MKQYAISFGIGAAIGSSFSKAFQAINGGLDKTSKKLNDLTIEGKKAARDISKLKNSINSNTKSLEKNKNELKDISLKKEEYRRRIEALNKQKLKEATNTEKISKEQGQLKAKLWELNKEYEEKIGKSKKLTIENSKEKQRLEELSTAYKKLGNEIETTEKKKKRYEKAKQASTIATKLNSFSKNTIQVAGGMTAIGVGYLNQAIKSESSFADVKKQFDFVNKEEEEVFKKELHKIITKDKLAIPINELYQAAAYMGQSGIKGEESIKYVEIATKMGIAFDMTRDEAAKSMLALKNSFQLPQEELSVLLNQINALANNSGASGEQLTDFMGRVGNIGKIAGFTEAQIAGVGAALIEQGMSAEIASSGVKKVFGVLTKGFAATGNEKEALSMLGLDSEILAKEVQINAEGAMMKVLTNISKLKKDKQGAVMKLLFGEEGLRVGAGLITNIDKMQTHMKNIQTKNFYEGSIEKEVKARNNTTENQLIALKAEWEILSAQIGTGLIPLLREVTPHVSLFFGKIASFMNENPERFKSIVSSFVKITAALYGMSAGLKIASATLKIYSAYMSGKGLFTGIDVIAKTGPILAKLKTGVMVVGGAIKMINPWVAIAIAVGVALYKNWDKVKESGIKLKEATVAMVEAIGEKWQKFKTNTMGIFNTVCTWVENKWDSLKEKGMNVATYFVEMFENIKNGLNSINPLAIAKKGLKHIGNKIGIPFAKGGVVSSPTLAMVGEGGDVESIIPHNKSQRSYDLWKNAGEKIGAFQDNVSAVFNFTFAPVVHASDSRGVQEVLERERRISQKEFERMYNNMIEDSRRRGYGR